MFDLVLSGRAKNLDPKIFKQHAEPHDMDVQHLRLGAEDGCERFGAQAVSLHKFAWRFFRQSSAAQRRLPREEADSILTPLVFCRRRGQAIKTVWKRWQTACEGAGCPDRIPHDFRRTAVRNLNRAGVPETVAMKITGHKTRSVFDRYDITSEEDLADASRKLQALAGAIPGTIGQMDAEALREVIGKSVKGKGLVVAKGRIELPTLRFSVNERWYFLKRAEPSCTT